MKKILMAMLFVLSLVAVPAMADVSSNYDFEYFTVAGINALDYDTIYVERGDEVPVTVYFYGTGETTDVNVKVWIGGYEYDYVHTASEMFDVEDGVWYAKTLSLQLPDDMIAEQDYTVYVEMYDDEDYVRYEGTVQVSKERHDVRVQDILVDNSVEAGDYTSVTVRLENMGDRKEEDIKVTLSSEALNLELSTYLDELTNHEIDNEDEEGSGDVTFTFEVPAEADGDYDLTVDVLYDNGHESVSDSETLSVEGQEASGADDGDVVIVDDTGSDEDSDDTSFVTALKLGFGILAVLIVILALILIVRK